MKVVLVLGAESMLVAALIGVVFASTLRRRSRFWLRFAGIAIAIVLPALLALTAILERLGEQVAGPLFWLGLLWGSLLVAGSRFVLFHDAWGSDPEQGDDDGEGPGPWDGRPTPPPIGGLPLPDSEPSLTRVRDHRPPRRPQRPRGPVRERERIPSRIWPIRLPV